MSSLKPVAGSRLEQHRARVAERQEQLTDLSHAHLHGAAISVKESGARAKDAFVALDHSAVLALHSVSTALEGVEYDAVAARKGVAGVGYAIAAAFRSGGAAVLRAAGATELAAARGAARVAQAFANDA